MTLEQLKNDYAKSKGYKDWVKLLTNPLQDYEWDNTINELLILAQQEQQKIIAENTKVEIKVTSKDEPSIITKYENEDGYIIVNKQSIINENNLIK